MPKRVLVADDSPTIRKIVQLCLAEAQIDFVGAAGGKQAVAALSRGVPDLVLADVVMPSPDGYAICERVKNGEFGRSVPVVLLADPFEPFNVDRAMAVGADGHITKPFDAGTLLEMVGDQVGEELSLRARLETDTQSGADAVRLENQESSSAEGGAGDSRMTTAELDAVARRVVRMISENVVREIAWEVVPQLSEILIREQLLKR